MEGGRIEAGSSLSRVGLRWILSQPPINRKQARSLLCPLPYETLPSFVECSRRRACTLMTPVKASAVRTVKRLLGITLKSAWPGVGRRD